MQQEFGDSAVTEAGEILFMAYRTGFAISALPDHCKPHTAEDGYRIQAYLTDRLGGAVAGWKVGATSQAARDMLHTDGPFLGNLLENEITKSPADLTCEAFRAARVEAEYLFVLRGMNSALELDESKLMASIKAVHLGIEVCETRFKSLVEPGVPSLIADNAVARHLVVGPDLPDWSRADLTDRLVTMSINGEVRAEGTGKAVLNDPIRSLFWAVQRHFNQGDAVAEDLIVATGSCTGMTPVQHGNRVVARFDGLGEVSATF